MLYLHACFLMKCLIAISVFKPLILVSFFRLILPFAAKLRINHGQNAYRSY